MKIERLIKWFNGERPKPFKIVLNPTNRCNLKCMFCPNAMPRSQMKFKAEDELTDNDWIRIVEEGLRLGVREWSIIGGGEPLLRKDAVFSVISLIKSYDTSIDCELITNGTLFREGDIEELVKLGMDRILFSIDSSDADTHNYFRGVEKTFEKSTKNLELFSDFKKKRNTEKPYLKINMVLNNKNYDHIGDMVKFGSRIGAQEIALHPMREYDELNRETENLKINDRQNNEMIEHVLDAENISKRLGIFLNKDMIKMETKNRNPIFGERVITKPNSLIEEKIIETSCFEPLYTLLIDPKGNVSHCSPSGKGHESLNVKEKSLEEIWKSEKLESIRRVIMSGGLLEYCDKCGLTDMKESIRIELLEAVGVPNAL